MKNTIDSMSPGMFAFVACILCCVVSMIGSVICPGSKEEKNLSHKCRLVMQLVSLINCILCILAMLKMFNVF